MTRYLVEVMAVNVNYFPSKGSVSEKMIPVTIVMGKQIPDYKKKGISFGSYDIVYIGTEN